MPSAYCAQLARDRLAIAKFLFSVTVTVTVNWFTDFCYFAISVSVTVDTYNTVRCVAASAAIKNPAQSSFFVAHCDIFGSGRSSLHHSLNRFAVILIGVEILAYVLLRGLISIRVHFCCCGNA